MRLGPATDVARVTMAEAITALWTFSNASGISIDDIIERTAAAGVTIDGVLLKDSGVEMLALAGAGNLALQVQVTGDGNLRFFMRASGEHQWGDGTAAQDTNLYRAAANELATDDGFYIGGALDLAGDIELSERRPASMGASQNDLATATQTVQMLLAGGAINITGFAGGRAGRVIIPFNRMQTGDPNGNITLLHESGASAAANRMALPNDANVLLGPGESVMLWYDSTLARWRAMSVTI